MQANRLISATLSPSVTPVVFVLTLLLSSSLLFFVQPLFTKIVLPHVGGSPAVWTTAMLFFQTILIAGYLYAHLLTRMLAVRSQVIVHLGVWAAALFFLPLTVPEGWQFRAEGSAVWQTLMLFAAGVGLPFFALSANAPLIQFWYSRSSGPSAHDPYFLYGASNLGSLVALLGFPLLVEPIFGAGDISFGWLAGFVLLGVGLAMSGTFTRGNAPETETAETDLYPARPTLQQIVTWAFLAFIPSSLMLSVTLKISIDMGSFPLVWVVPLALYLLSFVVAFSKRNLISDRNTKVIAGASLAVLSLFVFGLHGAYLSWSSVGILLTCFFAVAVFAHHRLYQTRPAGHQLTAFYLTMSVGGALGGLFNSVIAPVVFSGLHEAKITVVLAVLLFIRFAYPANESLQRLALGLVIGLACSIPAVFVTQFTSGGNWTAVLLFLVLGGVLSVAFQRNNVLGLFGAAVALLLVGTLCKPDPAIMRDRSFFGTHVVSETEGMRLYGNGTTVHGAQRLDNGTKARPEPLFYYHRNGPLAQVLTSERADAADTIGIVGLGVGALACYSQPGQDWHFYEIDALVDQIARNTAYFNFLSDCTPDAPTHMGDARMVLDGQDDLRFDILVIDAYSSDAVPVHLTTHEAMQLYLDRLTPNGILVYHISNRYYEIDIPIGRSADSLGLTAMIQSYKGDLKNDPGDSPTLAVALAQSPEALGSILTDPRWKALESDGGRIWTDDFANLMSIIKR